MKQLYFDSYKSSTDWHIYIYIGATIYHYSNLKLFFIASWKEESNFLNLSHIFPINPVVQCAVHCNKFYSKPLRKTGPYSKFFWSVFSCIWAEYGEVLHIFLYSVQIRQTRTRKTPNTDTFHVVSTYTSCNTWCE